MVESFGIRDCEATFCTPRVLYGCAKTPGHLQRPVKSGISAPPKTAKVELRCNLIEALRSYSNVKVCEKYKFKWSQKWDLDSSQRKS